ncbi:VP5 [Marbled eel reovirus]|nr:VP5 [Marbled eel reovirus]
MGNVQTSTNVYNVNGDGNSFQPAAEMVATAAPAIDLKPGVLNPTGKLWVIEGDAQPAADNLVMYTDENGDYSYVTETMLDALNKACMETNMWEPMFTATRTGCGPLQMRSYLTTMSGYAGASPADAFQNGYVTNGDFISTENLSIFRTTLSVRLQQSAPWLSALETAMSLLTPDVTAGTVNCNWKSILGMLESVLPIDSFVRMYPNEFYTVAVLRYPALRPGTPDGKVATRPSPIGEVAGALNAVTSEVGNMSGSGSSLSAAISTVEGKELDLISANAPLPVSVFTPSIAPRQYNPAFIKPGNAHWIAQFAPPANIRVSVQYAGSDHTIQIGPGNTRVLDMNAMIDCHLSLDISGTRIPFKDNPDFSTGIPSFVLIQTNVPADRVREAADIQSVQVITASATSAINSSTNVRGTPTFDMLHLQTVFEREMIVGIPYLYGFGTFLFPSITSSSDFSNPTLMDGTLTITPLLLRETTYKGQVVDVITPADVMGNQTSEEVTCALANDAIVLVETNLSTFARVMGDSIPIASSTDDAATSAILSRLTVTETLAMRARTGDPRALPDFATLWQKAKRAASLFTSNPALALQAGIPVLADAGIISAVTSGVSTALRTGSLGKGASDAIAKLRARQSMTLLKQAFFDKVAALWPAAS